MVGAGLALSMGTLSCSFFAKGKGAGSPPSPSPYRVYGNGATVRRVRERVEYALPGSLVPLMLNGGGNERPTIGGFAASSLPPGVVGGYTIDGGYGGAFTIDGGAYGDWWECEWWWEWRRLMA